MPFLPQDERYLSRALELARAAVGLASPNPTVGCVLVNEGLVLGEGAHRYDQRDHAEIVALKQAEADHGALGSTAYVTLEPCSHQGRTGPCADALVAAGIARCVIATLDPNPRVRGHGLAKLCAAGIAVDVCPVDMPIARAACKLNDAFAFSIQKGRPFVTLKAALSVDGKLSPAPSVRTQSAPHWLTGSAAREDVQQLRHRSDAIITGIGTVIADDPSLTDRTGKGRRRPLLRVVLDSQLRIPEDSRLMKKADGTLLIFCSGSAPAEREAALLRQGAEIVRVATNLQGQLDLMAVLSELIQRQIVSVLLEGGSGINAGFLEADLADELILYFAASELGLQAVPFAANGISPYVLQEKLIRTVRESFANGEGEDVKISGYLHDPWADISSEWGNHCLT